MKKINVGIYFSIISFPSVINFIDLDIVYLLAYEFKTQILHLVSSF